MGDMARLLQIYTHLEAQSFVIILVKGTFSNKMICLETYFNIFFKSHVHG